MTSPLLSIITVARNPGQGLRRTNDSLRFPPDLDVETLLIDGASTDGSQVFDRDPTCRYTVVLSEPDTGIYDAMNKGIRAAKGRFLLFLNAGDELSPELNWPLVRSALVKEEVLYVGKIRLTTGQVISAQPVIRPTTFVSAVLPHQATFIPRRLFSKIGFYDLQYRITGDQEWFLRAVEAGAAVVHLDSVVALYEGGGVSELPTNHLRILKEKRRMFRTHLGWIRYALAVSVLFLRRMRKQIGALVRRQVLRRLKWLLVGSRSSTVLLLRSTGSPSSGLLQSHRYEAFCLSHDVRFVNFADPQLPRDAPESFRRWVLLRGLWLGAVREFEFEGPAFLEEALARAPAHVVGGTRFRDPVAMAEHRGFFRERYDRTARLQADLRSVETTDRWRREGHLVVGIHIRRGDSGQSEDGHNQDDGVYARVLRDCREMAARDLRQARFLLFSNQTVTLPTDDSTHVSTSGWKGDHYLMGRCDLLIGPPSSFTHWASYLYQVPVLHLCEATSPIDQGGFAVAQG